VYFIDLKRIIKVTKSFVSGVVAINKGVIANPAASFDGRKQSKLGCEDGFAGIEEFLETTHIGLYF
jgi:succinate-semialdehyde dehydrogenase/glutarate-semialdehyde dehydrogenase